MSEWSVCTPIDTFEHPETGSVIDLVSVVHIGEPGYYRKLGRYIMGRQDEGFAVHYELIGCAEGEEADETLGIVDRVKKRLMGACENASVDWMVDLELKSSYVNQSKNDLFRPEGSHNIDIDDSEISSRLGLFSHVAMLREARKMRRQLSNAAKRGPELFDEFIFNKLKKNISVAESGKPIRTERDRLILGRRNEVALTGVDEALQEDSAARLVLIWGLGHFAGLSSGLIERGYNSVERQDVQVAFNMTGIDRSIERDRRFLKRHQARADRHAAASKVGGIQGLLMALGLKKVPDNRFTPGSFSPLGGNQDFMKRMEKERAQWQKAFEKSRLEQQQHTKDILEDARKQREKTMKQIEADRRQRQKDMKNRRGLTGSSRGWLSH